MRLRLWFRIIERLRHSGFPTITRIRGEITLDRAQNLLCATNFYGCLDGDRKDGESASGVLFFGRKIRKHRFCFIWV